jgi:hypothetical protein
MTGDVRLLIVAALQLFFGCKLLATGYLLWALANVDRPYWPLVVVLSGLAFLQLFVLVGITQRGGFARRLGIGLCIAGGTVGLVLCLLAPLAWYLGRVFIALGLVLILPNAVALALLTSESAREWCDES